MVCYEFYKTAYRGGSISAEDWPGYEARAEAQAASYERTYTVSYPSPQSRSMAVCSLAETLYSIDLILNGEGGPVSSVSVGSVSTSYGSSASAAIDVSPAGQARELYRTARLYLDIYRGVG